MNGVSTYNVGKLWMWNNRKMKSVTFIHNYDVKCFYVVVQGTHKFVMMGRINFEDHVIIKRWRANEKMNVMGRMFKDEKNGVTIQSSLCLLLEVECVFKVLEFVIT
jgi:hypothetical protein